MGKRCYEIATAAVEPRRGAVLPDGIVVEADGVALAMYDDVPLLWFPTLVDLLRRYDLGEGDLVERPPETCRRAREATARRRSAAAG